MSNTTFIALVRVAIELMTSSSNYISPWTAVVKTYAMELLDKFLESHGANEHPTMESLLNGASSWQEYSEGGCALIYESDLSERFRDTAYGGHEEGCSYLDAQTSALTCAANVILEAVHKVEENPRPYIARIVQEEVGDMTQEHEVQCSYCGQLIPESEAIDIGWDEFVCQECHRQHFTVCEYCDEDVDINDTVMVRGRIVLETWCQSCAEEHAFYCDECGEYFSEMWHDSHYVDGRTLCESCYEEELDEDVNEVEPQFYGKIEDFNAPSGVTYYSFKPRPCPCCTQKEMGMAVDRYSREPLVPLLGFELEMEDHSDCGRRLDEDADFMNEQLGFTYCKNDSSLTDGIELVSQPCTIAFLMQKKPVFKKVFSKMIGLGYTSHDNAHCGLHVHISKGPLLLANTEALNNLLIIVDTLWDELVKFSRRTEYQLNRWAARYNTKDSEPTEAAKKAKKDNRGRYMAVNLQNGSTVEIRMMRGTLKLETFMATLQLVQRLVDVAISIDDPADAYNVTWDELIGHEYEELNSYVEHRFGTCPGYIPSAEDTEEEEAEVEAATEPETDHGTLSGLKRQDFRLGDIVEVVADKHHPELFEGFRPVCPNVSVGATGKVVAFDTNYVGVQFDEPFDGGYMLFGNPDMSNENGAWVLPSMLAIKVPMVFIGDRVKVKPGTRMAVDNLINHEGEVQMKVNYTFEGEEHHEVGVSFDDWHLGHELDGWVLDDSGLWLKAEELIRTKISPALYEGQRIHFVQDGHAGDGNVAVIEKSHDEVYNVGIEVDEPFNGHNLGGSINTSRGWYVSLQNIIPLEWHDLKAGHNYEP